MAERLACPYCGRVPEFVPGTRVYPHRPDLGHKRFYLCARCDAYVGVHHGSTRPLGRLANAELRAAKIRAHAAFDPMWKGGGMSRPRAYQWLAEQLGIRGEECHVGMFDVETCDRVVRICERRNGPKCVGCRGPDPLVEGSYCMKCMQEGDRG